MPKCPQCGSELASGDPAGLCPKCLIQGAFDSSAGGDEFKNLTLGPRADASDDEFGRYQIVRSIGEGGMGTVYLAEQREPIRRCVALKVVKLGMDTSQVLARFANERQALAMMDHPNIARIFDAGATRKGRPYFVMEYIEGLPITQYCDRERMAIGRRLELFLSVCRAVQHAHQKGVIHRDLKPSNVLVMEQEGKAAAKVIDFGIAKATDQWAVEKTLQTQFGQMVGTPEYASPEQAEVLTGEVDQTSDVYSLGVILYELLIGTVPFDAARMRQGGFAEMLRIIREEEAPALSRRLSAIGAAAADIASQRQTDPASLRRLIDGDLNCITMKALEKARERRYASAAELAFDIERYLEHRPVLASPPRSLYRARKFIRRHRPVVFGSAASLAFLTLAGLTMWSFVRHGSAPIPRPGGKGTVVLADFANATNDPAFDGRLRQIVAAQVASSAYLAMLSDAHVSETLRLMGRSADAKLTPDVAAEICQRAGGAAVVEGSISTLGGQYLLGLRSRNCQTGDVLGQAQAPAGKKEEVFETLGEMASRFGSQLGRSLPDVEKEPGMSAGVTTPSLEAWKTYNAAMKDVQDKGSPTEAIPLLKQAIELDPRFAMAYALLGRTYDSLGEWEMGSQNIATAYGLRDRVSDQENLFIRFNYQRQVTGNLEMARQTLESWAQKYPREMQPHAFLSGFTSSGTGHFDRAIEEAQKALQFDPDFSIAYYNGAFAYIYLNHLSEAEALLRRASERKIEVAQFSLCRYFITFLKNDKPAMQKEITERRAKLEAQGWFEHQEAMTFAYQGRLQEADRLSRQAVNLARQGGLPERAAMFQGARAVWNALFGLRQEAQIDAAAALSLSRGRDSDYGPALALALLHDTSQVHAIEANLEKRYPQDTSVQFSYLPTLGALNALNQGDAAKALELTQIATPYELAVPGTAYFTSAAFFGAMYPVYVRGLAYSRLGRHREAAAEFQKILDHPGIVLNDPIGPMSRLQLARALCASGDRAKSAIVYQDLLAIWKDANPDIAIVQEAKAESAKLH